MDDKVELAIFWFRLVIAIENSSNLNQSSTYSDEMFLGVIFWESKLKIYSNWNISTLNSKPISEVLKNRFNIPKSFLFDVANQLLFDWFEFFSGMKMCNWKINHTIMCNPTKTLPFNRLAFNLWTSLPFHSLLVYISIRNQKINECYSKWKFKFHWAFRKYQFGMHEEMDI